MLPMELAEKTNQLRAGRPISGVARQIGASEGWLRQLEKGQIREPRLPRVLALARFFGVPLDWLGDDSADWPPPQTEAQRGVDLVAEALASAGLVGELTDDERELLAAYRRMAPRQRDRLVGYAIGQAASGTAEGAALGAALGEALGGSAPAASGGGRRKPPSASRSA